MFGFARPARQHLEYRQSYARCCMHQHLHYGVASLPLLSYEAVLLYLMGIDAGACAPPPADSPRCCRLRTSRSLLGASDARLGRFCASLGLLLGSIKVEDDLRDGSSWRTRLPMRLASWKWRGAFRQANEYFTRLDPRFPERTRKWIDEHLELESRSGPVPLAEYAQPTADAFAFVFSLAVAAEPKLIPVQDILRETGRRLGAAIISFDCAVDYPRDLRRGEYNPLQNEQQVDDALTTAREHLLSAARLCRSRLARDSQAAAVLASRAERMESPCTRSLPQHVTSWAKNWFASRMRRHVVLYDCPCECCCAGCEAGDCGGCDAGGDGGACCDGSHNSGADACCCFCDATHCGWGDRRTRKQSKPSVDLGKK